MYRSIRATASTARHINMNRLLLIAVFFALPAVLAQAGPSAHPAQTESQQSPPPPCAVTQVEQSAAAAFVDEPLPELKKQFPSLRTISVDPEPDQLTAILDKTGDVLAGLYQRIPNLVAREEVRRPIPSGLSFAIPLARRGGNLDATLDDSPNGRYRSTVYVYRIVRGDGPAGMEILNEFRTDSHDHPIDDSGRNPDSPRNVGFATSWLFFFRANQIESRFRLLGEQKIDKHDTYVVAFAQNPGRERLNTIVDAPTGQCSIPSQGVAWINQSTYQIIRMQTDLLFPVPSIHLSQLRTILEYSEVPIPERSLVLWLPDIVKNSWRTPAISGEELHLYSHYRLFGSTVRVLPAAATPSSPQTSPQTR
jgi:hypothetical protein